ncbi:hypothetical protein A6V39_03975 [Candidatus Mycoplasma haematobovis]|uniref:Uncharacterized protein n=1 Tax=Candidatus Mycoplasma haematobovis TaxID=432608 RepID=A0A1A9QDL4_9MOLU|nr:RDD family protein [Candidatus Mycoplasma haematobovis]OAL10046.1 hypothetical protein A6V39_03975 [Candidatus Mycoplasma haematobovis]
MENNYELELYLRKIRAGFGKRLIVTIFDLFYLLCMLFPVFICVTLWDNEGWISTFHKIVDPKQVLPAQKCFLFSLIVIVVLYIYFVYIPATSDYQTFFANSFAIKAVDISNGFDINARPSQMQLLKLNAIPIFLLPIINSIFFGVAWAWGKDQNWITEILKKDNEATLLDKWMKYEYKFDSGVRILFAGMFFLQMYYLFTAAATSKALNWFTKSTGIIYIDLDKVAVLKQKSNTFEKPVFEFPGATIEYENLNEPSLDLPEEELEEVIKEQPQEEEMPAEIAINE